jgi:hypothetical protein
VEITYKPCPMSQVPRRNYCIPMEAPVALESVAKRIGAKTSQRTLKAGPGRYRTFAIALSTRRFVLFTEWEKYPGVTEIQLQGDAAGRLHREDFEVALSVLGINRAQVSEPVPPPPHKWIPRKLANAG